MEIHKVLHPSRHAFNYMFHGTYLHQLVIFLGETDAIHQNQSIYAFFTWGGSVTFSNTPPQEIMLGRGGCFSFGVYSMVESTYLLCLVVSRLKGVLVI